MFHYPDAPDAPRGLDAVETSRRHITIEWNEPRNDGGAPVRGYIIERRQGYSGRFVRIGRGLVYDTYFRDNNVYEGMGYEYRVAAENEAGEGTFSKPLGPVLAKDPFGKPLRFLDIYYCCKTILVVVLLPENEG